MKSSFTFSEAARAIRQSANNTVNFHNLCDGLQAWCLIDKHHKPTDLGWKTGWFTEQSNTWFDHKQMQKITTHHYFVNPDGMNALGYMFGPYTSDVSKAWIIKTSIEGKKLTLEFINDLADDTEEK